MLQGLEKQKPKGWTEAFVSYKSLTSLCCHLHVQGEEGDCSTLPRDVLQLSHWHLPRVVCHTHCCLWTLWNNAIERFLSLLCFWQAETSTSCSSSWYLCFLLSFLSIVVTGCPQINVNWGSSVLDLDSMHRTQTQHIDQVSRYPS